MIRRKIALFLIPFFLLCGCSIGNGSEPSETPVSEITTSAEMAEETETTFETEATEVTTTVTEVSVSETETSETEEMSRAELILEGMSTEEKIMQLFVVTPEQIMGCEKTEYLTAITDEFRDRLSQYPVGGVAIFGGNIVSPEQITEFNAEFSSHGMFVAIDEEGGDIVRIAGNENFDVPRFLPANEIEDPYEEYTQIAKYLGGYGFNTDFAPITDIAFDDQSVIGNRAFGSDPEEVADKVSLSVDAFNDSGILCSLKHFPGHGAASADTHYGFAVLDKTSQELLEAELIPFKAGIDHNAPFVMVGHITVPSVTGDLPATLSPEMMSILRDDLGFEGLIITDSFWMGAITDSYTSDEAAVMALKAGADMILMPDDLDLALEGVRTAVSDGTLTMEELDSKVLKVLETKISYGII